jgi:hypothetical protein
MAGVVTAPWGGEAGLSTGFRTGSYIGSISDARVPRPHCGLGGEMRSQSVDELLKLLQWVSVRISRSTRYAPRLAQTVGRNVAVSWLVSLHG